jgi:hypothetical protein
MKKIILRTSVSLWLFSFSCASPTPKNISTNSPDSAANIDSTGKYDFVVVVGPDSSVSYNQVCESKRMLGSLNDFEKIIADYHKKFSNSKVILSVPDCFEVGVLTQLLEKAKRENVKVVRW